MFAFTIQSFISIALELGTIFSGFDIHPVEHIHKYELKILATLIYLEGRRGGEMNAKLLKM